MKSWQKSLLQSVSKKQVAFLILAVVALYLPAVWGTIVTIDDQGIMKFYGSTRLTLLDAISPGPGYYYRPLIALSYYLDYQLFGQNTYLLHLENVLIHAANAALVFLLARRLFPAAAAGLPLAAALIFATHPVNCEAVSWIAGRTDPLAAFFVLLASLSLCKGLENGRVRHGVYCVLLLLSGVLAKETAVLFIPASLLLVYLWPRLHPDVSAAALKRLGRVLCLLYLGIALALALLLVYRMGSHGNSVQKLFSGDNKDVVDTILSTVRLLGFYLKKMLVPWPLNFAITSVPGWYLIPGLAGLLLLVFAPKRTPYYISVCIGFLFLLPALVVGVFDVAWTMAAERYLYIPSAFFSLAVTWYLYQAADRMRLQRLLLPVFSLCILIASVSSVQRTVVWHSNLTLFEDTVAKSPDFGMLRNELAVALILEKRVAEAEEQLRIASSLDISPLVRGLIRRNKMLISLQDATDAEKRRIINNSGLEKSEEDTELLTILRRCDYALLKSEPAGPGTEALVSELIEVSEILFARTGEALLLYNNGQLFLERGDLERAATCFDRSFRAAPDGAHYKDSAGRLAEKLVRSL